MSGRRSSSAELLSPAPFPCPGSNPRAVSEDGALRPEIDRLVSCDDSSLLDEVQRVGVFLPDGPMAVEALRRAMFP